MDEMKGTLKVQYGAESLDSLEDDQLNYVLAMVQEKTK